MNPTIKALRSIGSEFAQRIYMPIAIITAIVGVILIALAAWLITVSAWWWILQIVLILAALIATFLLVIVGVLINTVRPTQNKTQKDQVKRFVDKIQSLAEVVGTPKMVILFRIVRDFISKREDSYTRRISSETLSMQHDLRDIIASFK